MADSSRLRLARGFTVICLRSASLKYAFARFRHVQVHFRMRFLPQIFSIIKVKYTSRPLRI